MYVKGSDSKKKKKEEKKGLSKYIHTTDGRRRCTWTTTLQPNLVATVGGGGRGRGRRRRRRGGGGRGDAILNIFLHNHREHSTTKGDRGGSW